MKIATTDFGNYTTKLSHQVQHSKAEQNNTVNIKKQNSTSVVQKQNNTTTVQKEQLGTVTNEEKKFFAGLYPENKTDIMNYHFYHKNGKMQGVTLGTIFDKRG